MGISRYPRTLKEFNCSVCSKKIYLAGVSKNHICYPCQEEKRKIQKEKYREKRKLKTYNLLENAKPFKKVG